MLAFNVIGFAEGYLLRDLGLVWLLPVLIVTALVAVLASRRWWTGHSAPGDPRATLDSGLKMNEKPPDVNSRSDVIKMPTAAELVTAADAPPTVWLSANFASSWYADAKLEAIGSGDIHGRRREITFSVAAAESYLLEWVRDEVLKRDFVGLDKYFPPDQHRSVKDKWKEITKALVSDGRIPAAPSFAGKTWNDFHKLVCFRNGLIHARASRPQTSVLSESQLPVPSMEDLQTLAPGWATEVVTALIRELHMAAGTKEPNWLGVD